VNWIFLEEGRVMAKGYKISKNTYGYFEVLPKPSVEELEAHYSQKYYQQSLGSYERSYSADELRYFEVESDLCLATIKKYMSLKESLLDVGCGEGFFAKKLFDMGWSVKCVDFSSEGLSNHNPELLDFFDQGDLLTYLNNRSVKDSEYGLINLDNVLEHVVDPEQLLVSLRNVMGPNSIARIEVPNDFSRFQSLLLSLGCTEETWVSPPEHMSYFNKNSLVNLLNGTGFEVVSLQADFPIEQFLLNDNSNYWKDRGLGKAAHLSRVICTNYMAEVNLERYIDYKEAAADLEFGRQLTAYIKLA